jgi:hypothetical protein
MKKREGGIGSSAAVTAAILVTLATIVIISV